ncbi:hypothetical protein ACMGE6_04420 [Macrococcus equi]|uniref:hypothetical protein n=1 Tax=Macrococcus equi TaxID=3395462 RepID=UPI0039BE7954
MFEWIMATISEELLLDYLAYYLIAFTPLFLALLYTLFNVKVTINLICRFKIEPARQLIEQFIYYWNPPILRWRIRCLAKLADDEDAIPLY